MGYEGSANFLTGIGGFLQAIINGYGGIRFHLDGQRSLMVIQKTHFLPTTMGYSINGKLVSCCGCAAEVGKFLKIFLHLGIKFAKSKFSLAIHKNGTTLKCLEKGDLDIELSLNSQKYAIDADSSCKLLDNSTRWAGSNELPMIIPVSVSLQNID